MYIFVVLSLALMYLLVGSENIGMIWLVSLLPEYLYWLVTGTSLRQAVKYS